MKRNLAVILVVFIVLATFLFMNKNTKQNPENLEYNREISSAINLLETEEINEFNLKTLSSYIYSAMIFSVNNNTKITLNDLYDAIILNPDGTNNNSDNLKNALAQNDLQRISDVTNNIKNNVVIDNLIADIVENIENEEYFADNLVESVEKEEVIEETNNAILQDEETLEEDFLADDEILKDDFTQNFDENEEIIEQELKGESENTVDKSEISTQINWQEGQILAVAFLGYSTDNINYNEYLFNYFDENEIENTKYYNIEGDENYLIIPRYSQLPIKIYEYILTDTGFGLGEPIYEISNQKHFAIKCNVSDLFSNIVIEVDYGNDKYQFSPRISLENGSMIKLNAILDISE